MNDISALLVATTVLSIGGMGMVMYKSTDETYEEEEHDETSDETTSAIDLGNVWNSITEMFNLSEDENVGTNKKYKETEDEDHEEHDNAADEYENEELEEDEYYERPKKKQQRYKTKRNKKTGSNTKRRY